MSIYKEMVDFQESNPVGFAFKIAKIARNVKNSERVFDNTPFNANEIIIDEMNISYGMRAVYEQNLNGGGITHVEATVYYVRDLRNNVLMDRKTYMKALDIVQSEMNKQYS